MNRIQVLVNRDSNDDRLIADKAPECDKLERRSSDPIPNLDESSCSDAPSTASVRNAFSSFLFAKKQSNDDVSSSPCKHQECNNEKKKSFKRRRPGAAAASRDKFAKEKGLGSFLWTLGGDNDEGDQVEEYGRAKNLGRHLSGDGSFVWAVEVTDDPFECDNYFSGSDGCCSDESSSESCDEETINASYDTYEQEESHSSLHDDTDNFSSRGVSSMFAMFGSAKKVSRDSGLFSSNCNFPEEDDDLPNNDGLDTIHRGDTIEEDQDFVFGLPTVEEITGKDTDITLIDGTSRRGSSGNYSRNARSARFLGGGSGISNNKSRRGGRREAQQIKQDKHEQQLSKLHKKFTRDELLGIFEKIDTDEAASVIINDQIGRIKKEMKKNGFVTNLALLQVSRGIVEKSMIREIEKGEAKKHLSSFQKKSSSSNIKKVLSPSSPAA